MRTFELENELSGCFAREKYLFVKNVNSGDCIQLRSLSHFKSSDLYTQNITLYTSKNHANIHLKSFRHFSFHDKWRITRCDPMLVCAFTGDALSFT